MDVGSGELFLLVFISTGDHIICRVLLKLEIEVCLFTCSEVASFCKRGVLFRCGRIKC